MGLRSLIRRPAHRGVVAWMQRLRSQLMRDDPLFELPGLLEKPAGTRAMVIAPHPDDETFGCGGTIYQHHRAGDSVTAVFMTDGGEGHALAGGVTGEALVELREREARAAAAVLGISECVFLRNPDTFLECSTRTIGQVTGLLESRQPDLLYAPSPLDTHRDHRQACAIVARALAGYSRPLQVYLYELWAPVPANCAVAIDLERKIQACRIYRSQMDERELYVATIANLARYRGLTCRPGQELTVECFLRMDRATFAELARNLV